MNVLLAVRTETQPLERQLADLAIAFAFSDERPLRGGAGRIDWRLCGLVSRLIAAGAFDASPGAALLVPSAGRLAAPRALLLGLGPRDGFGLAGIRGALTAALRRGLDLGARRFALSLPSTPPDAVSSAADALVIGALEAIQERGDAVSLSISVSEDELWASSRALDAAASAPAVASLVAVTHADPTSEPLPPLGGHAAPGARL